MLRTCPTKAQKRRAGANDIFVCRRDGRCAAPIPVMSRAEKFGCGMAVKGRVTLKSMFDYTGKCVMVAGSSHAIGRDFAVGLVTAPGDFGQVRKQAEPAAFAEKHALQWRGQ